MSTNQNKHFTHSFFMNLALVQARNALGNTKDNPAVGCVIVKNNSIISAASTSINGRPHAEQNAINCHKKNIKGSIIYVTLEPCSHYGKTTPCVNAIIKNKIKKVFFSLMDPDKRSYNKCKIQFIKNKIKVKNGILASDIKNFYKSYFKYKKENDLPYLAAKIAISKDFYTKNVKNKWITNEFSRGRSHFMRSLYDSILTGVQTVIKDNSKLTCRIIGLENRSPTRFVLDKQLKIPIDSYIVKSAKKYSTIIFFNKINTKKIDYLKKSKIKLIRITINKNGEFNLKNILKKIKLLGYSRIFLESGLKLTTNFLRENLIDDFYLFVSNKKLGINGRNSFKKNMKLFFNNKKFNEEKVNLFGDKLISYRIK